MTQKDGQTKKLAGEHLSFILKVAPVVSVLLGGSFLRSYLNTFNVNFLDVVSVSDITIYAIYAYFSVLGFSVFVIAGWRIFPHVVRVRLGIKTTIIFVVASVTLITFDYILGKDILTLNEFIDARQFHTITLLCWAFIGPIFFIISYSDLLRQVSFGAIWERGGVEANDLREFINSVSAIILIVILVYLSPQGFASFAASLVQDGDRRVQVLSGLSLPAFCRRDTRLAYSGTRAIVLLCGSGKGTSLIVYSPGAFTVVPARKPDARR